MYHSQTRTVEFNGKTVVLKRREDGKMPCACFAESHARFDFLKVFNMIRNAIHPPLDDPGNNDIPFQQSTPPRPPANPIDPTSMEAYTSAPLQPSSAIVLAPQTPMSMIGFPTPPTLPPQPSTPFISPPKSPDHPMADVNVRGEPGDSMDIDSGEENVTKDERKENGPGSESDYSPDGQESDSDGDGEDIDMDSPTEDLPASASQNADNSRMFLLQYGIQVDPIYRFVVCIEPGCQKILNHQYIYRHKKRKHYMNTKTLRTRLPPAPEILAAITSLGGHRPSPPDPLNGPIDPIVGVEVVNGTKCTIGDCFGHVHVNRESIREHRSLCHPMVPVRNRSSLSVKCQSLNGVKQYRSYIEVHPPLLSNSIPKGLELVLNSAEACNLLKQDDVFTLASSEQEKCAVFAQSHWDELLDGVSTDALIQTASTSFHFSNPSFLLLRDYVRDYYQDIVPTLDSIPVLARRYLLTPKVNEPLKNKPFRRPQEFGRTVERDADNITRFLAFLIIHQQNPVNNFPVFLHPDVQSCLSQLYSKLGEQNPVASECKALIHETVWVLIEKPSTKFLEDDRFCPFTRFLVAAHLKPHGQFVRANVISPFIGYIQWSLRATTAKKLISISHELGGDYLAAFDTLREFISEGKQVLFNSLRQSMHLISSIAYRQQGLARFLWSPDRKTLSIDGFPVHIPTFLKNIQRTLLTTIERVQTLFRGCEYLDILDHIDQGMVPDEVGQTRWFRDCLSNDNERYSFIEEEENGLQQFSDRLLLHLIEKTNLFGWVDGKLVANRRHVSDWFSELDQIVRELFYLVVTTWGGGARGTEMEKLLFANHLRNTRNVFFINGFLTFITEYSKTQSITGAGRVIARTPAFQVNRLLTLIILVAYKAAGYLNCYMGADKMACTPYFYDVFVCRGKPMESSEFTKALGEHNRINAGVELKLADFRQFMACVLISSTSCGFLDMKDEDDNVQAAYAVHESFNHSVQMGQAHYGLDDVAHGTRIAPDAVAHMQQVSLRWQAFMGLVHPVLHSKLPAPTTNGPFENSNGTNLLIKEHFRSFQAEMASQFEGFELRTQHFLMRMFESLGTQLVERLHIGGQVPTYQNPRRPSVHPDVKTALRAVVRRPFQTFTSPEQAQLINSVRSNMHVVGVLETGGGKSMAFLCAPKLVPGKLFVVVSPLVALTEDLRLRLQSQGINGGVYHDKQLNIHTAELILVSAHVAASEEFSNYLTCDGMRGRLSRVFIDEAHQIVTGDTYRPCFRLFHRLTATGVPITFLSATLMPRSIPYLLQVMKITDTNLIDEIRRYTGRRNLRYKVERLEEEDEIFARIINLVNVEGGQFMEKDQGLIFCRTIENVKWLGDEDRLGCPIFHGQMGEKDKIEASKRWREGKTPKDRWMVCTLAFGQGVDYSHVRVTIHKDPWELINYVQETGRSGRDQNSSVCYAFWSSLPPALEPGNPDHIGREEMRRILQSSECLRLGFAALDRESWSCVALDGELCSNCEKAAKIPFQLSIADFPRLDKPLVPSNPSNPLSELVPITVDTHAAGLREQISAGERQLLLLKHILDSVQANTCLDCWVYNQQHRPTVIHKRHWAFNNLQNQLKIYWSPNENWPFCWHCWVPLRHPCNHPPPTMKQAYDRSRCPYQVHDLQSTPPKLVPIIPHLILLIFAHTERRSDRGVFEEIFAKELGITTFQVRRMPELVKWFKEPVTETEKVHNFIRYVISWYKLSERYN
ncbi:hypothetical protein F5050DRAFT_1812256 [Lentinula boryana]|uniref:DNA 3'-5' helicase n=1 Tax=Lentinula boryana TaxID=40481 RepID=A0ABQ8Q1V6_9AGAR|nr:hypothetical protein F5050DRAFT_1812256 [Lentinula boryana]